MTKTTTTTTTEKKPYVLAMFDWGVGHLRLVMLATLNGEILPLEDATTDVHQAYRWASRQAARQYLVRAVAKNELQRKKWQVLNLREFNAPWNW